MDSLFRRAGNLSLVISQTTEFADVFETVFAATRPIYEQIPCSFPVSGPADKLSEHHHAFRSAPGSLPGRANASSTFFITRDTSFSKLLHGRALPQAIELAENTAPS